MSEDVEPPDTEQEEQELYEHHRFLIPKGQELLRIDKFLVNTIANSTRTKIQQAAEEGCIQVNGKNIKPNYRIKPDDVITVLLPHPVRVHELLPENIPLNIFFEDDDIIIVNKPVNMVVHPGFGNYEGTLMNALVYHFQNLPVNNKQSVEPELRPGLVHRIDKNTSGIIVIAKNELTMTRMAKKFFERDIDRTYWALVWGDMKEESGTIEGNIGRSFKNRKLRTVFPKADFGKPAITHWKVIERLGYVTLVECKLETGRTHQIRVHMQYINHPLFNDNEYGGDRILKGTTFTKYKQFVENCFKLLPGQALHAKSLGFKHPTTKKYIHFDSELPENFTALLEKWRHYMKYRGDEERAD